MSREKYIPYGHQYIDHDDIQAIQSVLVSDYLTQGPAIERFEQKVGQYVKADYTVAVCNATAALHIACLTLGVGCGDEMWTSPNSFVASANCGIYCGAKVDFVDIDPHSYNISVERLAEKLEMRRQNDQRLPKAVITVAFAGQSADMKKIRDLADEYGFAIIDDASHAIGGTYAGKRIGCCEHADMTVFSFHPVKIITTGEGGMITTNNCEYYEKLIRLRSHGITRKPELMLGETEGGWYYQQIELGYNYRMTDIQAALGCSQMDKIDDFIEQRQKIIDIYNRELCDLPLVLPWQSPKGQSAWHLYVVQVLSDEIGKTRRQVYSELQAQRIGVNVHYIPIYLQPYYRGLGFVSGYCPEAERYYERAISLPLFAGLEEQDLSYVIDNIKRIVD